MDILTKECNIVHILAKELKYNTKEYEIFHSLSEYHYLKY